MYASVKQMMCLTCLLLLCVWWIQERLWCLSSFTQCMLMSWEAKTRCLLFLFPSITIYLSSINVTHHQRHLWAKIARLQQDCIFYVSFYIRFTLKNDSGDSKYCLSDAHEGFDSIFSEMLSWFSAFWHSFSFCFTVYSRCWWTNHQSFGLKVKLY